MANLRILILSFLTSLAQATWLSSNWNITADEIIGALNLTLCPEKGYYVPTFIDTQKVAFTRFLLDGTEYTSMRPASTAIYYLLEGDSGDSKWHKLDAVEVWNYYAGATLTLRTSWNDGTAIREQTIGPDISKGERPQGYVRQFEWQSARSHGNWTLMTTTVAPGFVADIGSFEVAKDDWEPKTS